MDALKDIFNLDSVTIRMVLISVNLDSVKDGTYQDAFNELKGLRNTAEDAVRSVYAKECDAQEEKHTAAAAEAAMPSKGQKEIGKLFKAGAERAAKGASLGMAAICSASVTAYLDIHVQRRYSKAMDALIFINFDSV